MSEWQKVETQSWKHEKAGDEIEGTLLGIRTNVGEFNSKVYDLKTPDGKQISIFGSTVLDDKLIYAEIGQQIKIIFKGKIKGQNKKEYNDYDVFTKPVYSDE